MLCRVGSDEKTARKGPFKKNNSNIGLKPLILCQRQHVRLVQQVANPALISRTQIANDVGVSVSSFDDKEQRKKESSVVAR